MSNVTTHVQALGTTHQRAGRKHQWIILKDLVVLLVQRELRVRYRGSLLGYLWSFMNPLMQMIVFAFVFSHIMRFKVEHFPLFLLSGILTWNLIHQSITTASTSIIYNGPLLRKVKLSSALFPLVSVFSALTTFLMAVIPYCLIAIVLGKGLSWSMLALPIVLLPTLGFLIGVALLIASVNVRFRDVGHMLDPILSIVFYGTPIIYPLEVLPEKYAKILYLNPAVHYVGPIRAVMFEGRLPTIFEFASMTSFAILALGIGLVIYKRMKKEFIFYV